MSKALTISTTGRRIYISTARSSQLHVSLQIAGKGLANLMWDGCVSNSHPRHGVQDNPIATPGRPTKLNETIVVCTSDCSCNENSSEDIELQSKPGHNSVPLDAVNSVEALSWLDHFLWLWILLAITTGVQLGYFVTT